MALRWVAPFWPLLRAAGLPPPKSGWRATCNVHTCPSLGTTKTQIEISPNSGARGGLAWCDTRCDTASPPRAPDLGETFIFVKGQEDKRFSLKTDILDNNGYRLPVFEVKVSKDVILHDQDKHLVALEKEVISVDGVNGPDITLGSLTQVSTSGNWPTTYDSAKQ